MKCEDDGKNCVITRGDDGEQTAVDKYKYEGDNIYCSTDGHCFISLGNGTITFQMIFVGGKDEGSMTASFAAIYSIRAKRSAWP